MKKGSVAVFSNKVVPQMVIQTVAIILSALASNMLMTFLIKDLAKVQGIYLSAAIETLGTLILMIIIVVPINTLAYRRRLKEVKTLSDGIQKIADGDFTTKIPINKRDQMFPVYENFNKMSAELASVQLLRNDFINSYSHEFKTPIASINGFASLLLDKEYSKEDEKMYLKIIKEESERLTNLATNTILLSKLSSQQIVTDIETYDLGEQLRQCSIILSQSWLEKKIEFSGDYPNVQYKGNKELMQHLWLNIIGNAVKYTPVGGEITAQLMRAGRIIRVVISDTGEGMTKETLEHMFDPYYQGDTSHATKGLGLGMSIAKRITELCNGTIRVESELSVGSQFIIELPIR